MHATATRRKDIVIAGPAPGRPCRDAACVPWVTRSSSVACSSDSTFSTFPAAAVPVTVKMPEPITAPMPRNVRLQGPSVFRSRLDGSSEDLISSSIDLVWKSDTGASLALALALSHLLYFALLRSACDVGGALLNRRRFLPRRALQLLTFRFVCDLFSVHSTLIPAYFAISFFNPYPGKFTVTFVSSPEPSRRTTVPRPYLA